jgi:hypothetical protein
VSVTDTDYVYETRVPLDERIARLAEQAREARAEAYHARRQPGLLGPAESARAAGERLEREAAELREVALRIDRGYPWWEREGFEIALDACALFTQWQPLSELVTREFVYGNDEVDLRLPVPVQLAYGKALESRFFSRFEVCSTFDVEGDEVVAVTHYLFGVQDFASLGACLFFVESWGS